MDKKTIIIILGGIITAISYIVISSLIQNKEAIWILTRIFGLLSFLGLFLVVMLGELRMTRKVKGEFTLFKFHKLLAMFSTFLVLLHFISAIFEKYKWGTYLMFTQYLGFSFSDSWLVYLSLGTLAFYLLIIIGASSANKSMQILGFKKWKFIHFLSYIAFATSYIHAVNLGTDLKTSVFATILHLTVIVMFLLVTGLFLLRILNSYNLFDDQLEINLTGVLIIVMILGFVFVTTSVIESYETLNSLSIDADITNADINYNENVANSLMNDITQLNIQLAKVQNG